MIFVNNLDPQLVEYGILDIRWYGLTFLLGILLNYAYSFWVFKREKKPVSDLDSLAVYLVIGLIIGARLGHVIFYQPEYFFSHPLEILKVWNGGLASHGAAIGILVAYLIWLKVNKVKFTKYADLMVLGIPLTAMFVRIGNFFNSEIVGVPTWGDYGVVFARLGEDFPRHPAQLYEALLSLIIFVVMFFVYKNYYKKTPNLFFVFLYMLLYFGGRFFVEFYKDLHIMPESFPLSMGQVLSLLPILLALIYFIVYFPRLKKR